MIEKGLQVESLKIACTDLTAQCDMSVADLSMPRALPLAVRVENSCTEDVFRAVIGMHITERKR